MNKPKRYTSAVAMRTALEERLNRFARDSKQDISRLRRQVAFDRFLARLFKGQQSNLFMLKGGYAIELRMKQARTTKDIDISFDDRQLGIADEVKKLYRLVQQAAAINLNDYFEYAVEESILDLENAVYGGNRFPVNCQMAGRRFARFNIDIAAGDVWFDTHEKVSGHQWLDFAGIPTPEFPVISPEQQFAEKIHSYSLPRQTQNSRTKDLIDLVLLIERCNLSPEFLREAIEKTFRRRKTHDIPIELEKPPESWKTLFTKLAAECGVRFDLESAIKQVGKFYKSL